MDLFACEVVCGSGAELLVFVVLAEEDAVGADSLEAPKVPLKGGLPPLVLGGGSFFEVL